MQIGALIKGEDVFSIRVSAQIYVAIAFCACIDIRLQDVQISHANVYVGVQIWRVAFL